MTCRELVACLGDLVDGELSGAVGVECRRHLARCPGCRAYTESYETTVALTRSLSENSGMDEPPEELVTAILASRAVPPSPTLFV